MNAGETIFWLCTMGAIALLLGPRKWSDAITTVMFVGILVALILFGGK